MLEIFSIIIGKFGQTELLFSDFFHFLLSFFIFLLKAMSQFWSQKPQAVRYINLIQIMSFLFKTIAYKKSP